MKFKTVKMFIRLTTIINVIVKVSKSIFQRLEKFLKAFSKYKTSFAKI